MRYCRICGPDFVGKCTHGRDALPIDEVYEYFDRIRSDNTVYVEMQAKIDQLEAKIKSITYSKSESYPLGVYDLEDDKYYEHIGRQIDGPRIAQYWITYWLTNVNSVKHFKLKQVPPPIYTIKEDKKTT